MFVIIVVPFRNNKLNMQKKKKSFLMCNFLVIFWNFEVLPWRFQLPGKTTMTNLNHSPRLCAGGVRPRLLGGAVVWRDAPGPHSPRGQALCQDPEQPGAEPSGDGEEGPPDAAAAARPGNLYNPVTLTGLFGTVTAAAPGVMAGCNVFG